VFSMASCAIFLADDELAFLHKIVTTGTRKVTEVTRAKILLQSHSGDSPKTPYRMTKIPVEEDIKSGKIDSFPLVVDTNGIGVESAVVGGQFNASKIAEAIQEYKVFDSVDHRIIVIPGMAARYSGALEDEANCYVCVGPRDSSGIPKLFEEKWTPDAYMEEYNSRKG